MKKIILAALMMSSAFAGNLSDEFRTLLQEKLSFSGTVEVTTVADAYVGYVVQFEVTSYGETRPNWCYIVDTEIVECQDDWFNN